MFINKEKRKCLLVKANRESKLIVRMRINREARGSKLLIKMSTGRVSKRREGRQPNLGCGFHALIHGFLNRWRLHRQALLAIRMQISNLACL